MTAQSTESRKIWMSALGALGFLLLVSCASTAPGATPPDSLNDWASLNDCFDRSVTVSASDVKRMAETCGGSSAAADPSRSGIERATAFFHAASAYNTLAASGTANALCASTGSCSEIALSLLDQSLASQQDNQITLTGNAEQVASNERFILRRTLERSRALRGVAISGAANASCGTRASCLTDAAALLGSMSVEIPPASEEPEAARLGCEILDARWRANSDLGREREYLYVQDLRRLVAECPKYAASASDRLAEISFERAESVKTDLSQAVSLPSIETSIAAITDYRDTLSTDRFRLPAHRGMGVIYRSLAKRDPSGTRTYLENAVDAYENAVRLSASGTASERATDHEQLGTSLMALSKIAGTPGSIERLALAERATNAFKTAVNIEATPARHALLGSAYTDTGQCTLAIPAFNSAIPGLSGADKVSAILALSSSYDACGQPDLALQTLKEATAAGNVSAEVRYEVGLKEFESGNFPAALSALRAAESGLNGAQAAEANYMMSVAETITRPEGWEKRALDHAERAVSLNARTWTYNRQACVAAILKGGKAVKNGSNLARCPDAGTPESDLLRGMFFLKQAQTMDVSAYNLASQTEWRSVLRAAETAFTRGQESLNDATERERVVRFDDLQADVDIAARLRQGLTVIKRCNREITIGSQDPVWKDLDAFFGHYGVLKCS